MPEIETARLQLRQFSLKDFNYLFRLYSDAEIMRYLSPRTREQTQSILSKHIQQWQQHNFGMWAVIHKETGTMIGRCGLGFLENTPEVELGYVFDKSYWNMGLATEASIATLKFGFGEVKLDRLGRVFKPFLKHLSLWISPQPPFLRGAFRVSFPPLKRGVRQGGFIRKKKNT